MYSISWKVEASLQCLVSVRKGCERSFSHRRVCDSSSLDLFTYDPYKRGRERRMVNTNPPSSIYWDLSENLDAIVFCIYFSVNIYKSRGEAIF